MPTSFVFDASPQPSVAVVATDARFPVRRIFCVGQNYADHVAEMGGDASKPAPFFFCKPADAIVNARVGDTVSIPYPTQTKNLHHEIELVVAIGKAGASISAKDALGHVFGYAVGVDLTRRDLQAAAKEKGRPWDTAKGFDNSAPIAPITRVQDYDHPTKANIWLKVNDEKRQDSDISHMIWAAPDIIAFLSQSFALKAGDLIFTGTPSGVGPIVKGDHVTGGVAGLTGIEFTIS